jgi:hypothetical protein
MLQLLKMDQLNFIVKKYDLSVENKRHGRKRTKIIRAIKRYWEENNPEECPICYEPLKIETIVITKCYHMFCDECIIRHHKNNDKCPLIFYVSAKKMKLFPDFIDPNNKE